MPSLVRVGMRTPLFSRARSLRILPRACLRSGASFVEPRSLLVLLRVLVFIDRPTAVELMDLVGFLLQTPQIARITVPVMVMMPTKQGWVNGFESVAEPLKYTRVWPRFRNRQNRFTIALGIGFSVALRLAFSNIPTRAKSSLPPVLAGGGIRAL